MSKRRTKVHFKAIHISIPIRLREDLDETLSFKQSRSAKISALIKKELDGDTAPGYFRSIDQAIDGNAQRSRRY